MDIEGKLNQKCVHWLKTGSDKYDMPTYGTPTEIDCRWDDVTELFMSLKGELEPSRSTVYSLTDFHPDDMLWYGTMAEYTAQHDGEDVRTFAHTVRRADSIPDIRAEVYLRMAFL